MTGHSQGDDVSIRVYRHPNYRYDGRRWHWMFGPAYFGLEAHVVGRVIELIYTRRAGGAV